MSGDDQSEDGQLTKSPERDFSMDDEETTDSLDIKPPQARVEARRYKEKKPNKEKKHSREHKHKAEREHGRHRDERQQKRHEKEPFDDSRHTSRSTSRTDRSREGSRYENPFYRDNRDTSQQQYSREPVQQQYNRETSHQQQYNREPQQQHQYNREPPQQQQYNREPSQQYSRNVVYKEREKPSQREREREKRKESSPDKSEGERMLQDLRTKLLSKKIKYDNEAKQTTEEQPVAKEHHRKEKTKKEHRHHAKDTTRKDYVEVIDSPEHYPEQTSSSKQKKDHHEAPKPKTAEEKEQEARRAKLIEADREMAKRKELAREELEARRKERQKTRMGSESPEVKKKRSAQDDEDEYDDDDDDDVVEMVAEYKSKPSGNHHSEDDDEIEEEEEERDTETSSSTSESEDNSEEHSDVPPISPLSVGHLSKSERKRLSPSRSRSSGHYESRSHSKSESRSRSRSQSRSRSRSYNKNLRNRSRSRSTSDDDEDSLDGKEIEDVPKKEKKSPEPKVISDDEKEKLPSYFPGIQGCRSVEEFQCLNRIEEGTYGVVYRAQDKRTQEIVALKRLKMEKEKEGFPITSLREINTLLKGQHPNIVTVREIVVGSNMDKIFIVMDYVEHDLKSLMETMRHKKQAFLPGEVKCLAQQLLRGVAHLHDNWIIHRDLKTSNLLLSHKGILKIGDFGLAREYGSPLKPYTSIVVTLWYRAPELLLCCKEYTTPIDIWSVGCIFAELLAMTALFPGKTEIDQLNKIFKDLGTPNEKIWPGYNQLPAVQKMTFTEYPVSNLRKKFAVLTSELGMSLLQGLLTYDPKQRLTAEVALNHSYFKEMPLPIDPAMFPTWPAKSELGLKKALASSPKPPSGGTAFKKLGDDNESQGFTLGAIGGNTYSEQRQMAMGAGFSLKF